MKKLLIVSLLFAYGLAYAQTSSIITGDDNKSWTLRTKSAIYQIGVTGDERVCMKFFGEKSRDINRINANLGFPVRGAFKSRIFKLQTAE